MFLADKSGKIPNEKLLQRQC